MLKQVLDQGVLGAAAGFVLACGAQCITWYQGEPEQVVYKRKDGLVVAFRNLEALGGETLLLELRIMSQFKEQELKHYNEACRLMQYLVDVHQHFIDKRQLQQDGLKEIARFEKAAIRTDAAWRRFTTALQDSMQIEAHPRTCQAAEALHKAVSKTLGSMRTEFAHDTKLKPTKALY